MENFNSRPVFCHILYMATVICLILTGSAWGGTKLRIEAIPAAGFYWPYILYLPSLINNQNILVVSNNSSTASDDFSKAEAAADFYYSIKRPWADALKSPFIVPIWPRLPGEYDGTIAMQSLGRGGFEEGIPIELSRVDLQLIAMIEDARTRLQALKIETNGKIYIWGGSSSANFANRFILLHPDRIRAAAMLAHGWTMLPIEELDGMEMHYPYGLGGVTEMTGRSFDRKLFKNIPLYIAMGQNDNNGWGMPWYVGNTTDSTPFYTWFNSRYTPWTATKFMQEAEDVYAGIESIADFVIYPNIGHTETTTMANDVLQFFQNAPPIPKTYPDITGDDVLTLKDLIITLQVLCGKEGFTDVQTPDDVNGDNAIGLHEAMLMLRELAQD